MILSHCRLLVLFPPLKCPSRPRQFIWQGRIPRAPPSSRRDRPGCAHLPGPHHAAPGHGHPLHSAGESPDPREPTRSRGPPSTSCAVTQTGKNALAPGKLPGPHPADPGRPTGALPVRAAQAAWRSSDSAAQVGAVTNMSSRATRLPCRRPNLLSVREGLCVQAQSVSRACLPRRPQPWVLTDPAPPQPA